MSQEKGPPKRLKVIWTQPQHLTSNRKPKLALNGVWGASGYQKPITRSFGGLEAETQQLKTRNIPKYFVFVPRAS